MNIIHFNLRTSWPPIRYLTRPHSPTSWTNTIHSSYPEGSVSRMPIPYTTIDSGFDEWKKTISKNEKSMKIKDIKLRPFYY